MRRRTALSIGATTATAWSVGLAGCLGILEDDATNDEGSNGGYGFGDLAPWLAAPDAFDPDSVFLTAVAPSALEADADALPSGFESSVEDPLADRPVGSPSAVDFVLRSRFGPRAWVTVAGGAFDTDAVATALADAEFRQVESDVGLECYANRGTAWGIDAETLVGTSWAHDPIVGLERAVGANAGNVRRLTDERDPLDRIATSQPAGEVLFVEHAGSSSSPVMPANRDDAVLAAGESFDVRGDETTITTTLVFASADQATEASLREYVADSEGIDPEEAAYRLDGDVGEIDVTRPTSDLA